MQSDQSLIMSPSPKEQHSDLFNTLKKFTDLTLEDFLSLIVFKDREFLEKITQKMAALGKVGFKFNREDLFFITQSDDINSRLICSIYQDLKKLNFTNIQILKLGNQTNASRKIKYLFELIPYFFALGFTQQRIVDIFYQGKNTLGNNFWVFIKNLPSLRLTAKESLKVDEAFSKKIAEFLMANRVPAKDKEFEQLLHTLFINPDLSIYKQKKAVAVLEEIKIMALLKDPVLFHKSFPLENEIDSSLAQKRKADSSPLTSSPPKKPSRVIDLAYEQASLLDPSSPEASFGAMLDSEPPIDTTFSIESTNRLENSRVLSGPIENDPVQVLEKLSYDLENFAPADLSPVSLIETPTPPKARDPNSTILKPKLKYSEYLPNTTYFSSTGHVRPHLASAAKLNPVFNYPIASSEDFLGTSIKDTLIAFEKFLNFSLTHSSVYPSFSTNQESLCLYQETCKDSFKTQLKGLMKQLSLYTRSEDPVELLASRLPNNLDYDHLLYFKSYLNEHYRINPLPYDLDVFFRALQLKHPERADPFRQPGYSNY